MSKLRSLEDIYKIAVSAGSQGIFGNRTKCTDYKSFEREFQEEIESLQSCVEEQKDEVELVKAREQVLSAKNEQLQEDNNRLRTEVIRLNSVIKSEHAHSDFQKNIESLIEKERTQFRAQLLFSEKKIETLKKDGQELKLENQKFQHRNEFLNQELQKWKEKNIEQLSLAADLQVKLKHQEDFHAKQLALISEGSPLISDFDHKLSWMQTQSDSANSDLGSRDQKDRNLAEIIREIQENKSLQQDILHMIQSNNNFYQCLICNLIKICVAFNFYPSNVVLILCN